MRVLASNPSFRFYGAVLNKTAFYNNIVCVLNSRGDVQSLVSFWQSLIDSAFCFSFCFMVVAESGGQQGS